MIFASQAVLINDEVKKHAILAEDWSYRELAVLLHEWAERFNEEFALGLETPAIQIDRAPRRVIGTYRRGRNGLGLRHEITVNTRHLDQPLAEILDTLLHELLHEWQDLHGTPGKRNYHNVEFRNKAGSYGLIIDRQGRSLGVAPGLFLNLLGKHGVDTTVLTPVATVARKYLSGESKMKKWSCGCINVRAAVELKARCLDCGALFKRATPSW